MNSKEEIILNIFKNNPIKKMIETHDKVLNIVPKIFTELNSPLFPQISSINRSFSRIHSLHSKFQPLLSIQNQFQPLKIINELGSKLLPSKIFKNFTESELPPFPIRKSQTPQANILLQLPSKSPSKICICLTKIFRTLIFIILKLFF